MEVRVRVSERARYARVVIWPGEPPELVVPRGTSDRQVARLLAHHRPWIERQLARRRPPSLGLEGLRLPEAEWRAAAREALTEVAEREAPKLGVAYERIAVRDQKTRWGSCSSRGTLSFNWRLVLAPEEVLDYVVVHELCHLREPNHSQRFWRLVEDARPGWQAQRDWLRMHGPELQAFRPAA